MNLSAGVVIVGASLAGLTTAEGLRNEGYAGAITLVGEEDRAPYNRPPLSKQVLAGIWDVERTTMRDAEQLESLGVHHLRGMRATGVDVVGHTVTVGDVRLPFQHLVAATGVAARRLPKVDGLSGIHSLRTADDAMALRRDLDGAGRVAIVGAGVLGCEIASALRSAGHDVTLIGRGRAPHFGQTGGHLSGMISELLQENGVRMRMGLTVTDAVGRGRVSALRLSDGSIIPADVVVAAIGCTPRVGWLSGAGIDISDGVLCDANGVAAPDIYAVGDVARWLDPVSGEAHRVEHQATAIERAHAVAHLMVTGEPTAPIASFFWSELFGNRILVHGRLDTDVPLTQVAGQFSERRFVGATIHRGRRTGLVGWNMPREFRRERARLIQQPHAATEILKGSVLA
jgi:3-phenylpropionate/trans-cinnamate dioxygenase ferredoxin reductase component